MFNFLPHNSLPPIRWNVFLGSFFTVLFLTILQHVNIGQFELFQNSSRFIKQHTATAVSFLEKGVLNNITSSVGSLISPLPKEYDPWKFITPKLEEQRNQFILT